MRFFASVALVVLITGCAQTPRVVQGPFDSFISAQKSASECSNKIESSGAGLTVTREILALRDDSASRVVLMSSGNFLTDAQVQALLAYLAINEECRKIARGFYGPQALHSAVSAAFGDYDIIYSKLVSKELSIGKANQERLLVKQRTEATINAVFSGVQQQINQAAADQEAARRALATQYLLNQMQRPAYQVPVPQNTYKPPVQTNCTRIGDTLNCISR